MKTLDINHISEIPKDFTGIVKFIDGERRWYKEGKLHREDGPAVEAANGTKKNGGLMIGGICLLKLMF